MNRPDLNAISKCALFTAVGPDDLERLLPNVSIHTNSYPAGSLIRSRGEPCDELLVMLSGQVSGEFQDYGGHVLRVETISSPETIASAFLFAPEPYFPVNIVAVTDVRICAIPKRSVVALARGSEKVMEALLGDIGARTAFLAERLRLMQFATLRQKIAGYLLERADRFSTEVVPMSVSQKTIAELFGVARPSLGRVLHELEEAKVIRREHRSIRILDRDYLTTLLEDTE